MEDPERLDFEVGPRRRWPGLVLVVALAVLVGFGVLRLTHVEDRTAPSPSPSAPSSPTSPTAWPADLGSGTLYVLDSVGLAAIDLSTGQLRRVELRSSSDGDAITAARGGVLAWDADGEVEPRLITAAGRGEAGTALTTASRFLPGPEGSIWARSRGRIADGRYVWRLLDDQSAATATTALYAFVIGDGAGGLFNLDRDQVRHVTTRTSARWTGTVYAAGPDGYVTSRCFPSGCTVVLHDQTNGQELPLHARAARSSFLGALAPGNRLVATPVPVAQSDNSPTVITVSDAISDQPLGSFPGSDAGGALTWLSDRWLVATTASGLVLYDATTHRASTPVLPLREPVASVFQPS